MHQLDWRATEKREAVHIQFLISLQAMWEAGWSSLLSPLSLPPYLTEGTQSNIPGVSYFDLEQYF